MPNVTTLHPAAPPPMPAVMRILSQFDKQQLASFIEVAIGLLDVAAGDTDLEDDDPDTSVEDNPAGFDPETDRCLAGDDGVFSGPAVTDNHVGFSASPDLYCLSMDEDMEREQMRDDVPCLPVHALEPNIFNGKRALLGFTLPHYRGGKLEPEL